MSNHLLFVQYLQSTLSTLDTVYVCSSCERMQYTMQLFSFKYKNCNLLSICVRIIIKALEYITSTLII